MSRALRHRPARLVLAAIALSAGWCLFAAPLLGADPLLAIEWLGAFVLGGWGLLTAGHAWRGHALARRLSGRSRHARIGGVDCRVVVGASTHAFVVGALRPTIYLGDRLLEVLDGDELRAVILHEDHHRRTYAPLRSAALEAWLRLLGPSRRARAILLDRLALLEQLADADALRRGASPASLASALVKGDRSIRGAVAAFSYAADRRIAALLDAAAGRPDRAAHRGLPYEWLPVALLAGIVLGCHAIGIAG